MLHALLQNLRAGARLVFFRRVTRDEFVVDWAQVITLFVISSALELVFETLPFLFLNDEAPLSSAWYVSVTYAASFVIASWAIALIQGHAGKTMDVIAVVAAFSIILYLTLLALAAPLPQFADAAATFFDSPADGADVVPGVLAIVMFLIHLLLILALMIWSLVVTFRAIRCVFDIGQGRALLLWLVFMAIGAGPALLVEELFAPA